MLKTTLKTQQGFTLIEIMVSITVFTMLGLGVVMLISNAISSTNKVGVLSANADQARKISFKMMNELRNAVTSSTGTYALSSADDQAITFYTNIDTDAAVERIRYYIDDGKLYRGLLKPTGSPLAYVAGNETLEVVQDNVANGATPLFYYFDDSYDGTGSALTSPVTVTQVKLVRLNLLITNVAGVENTNFFTVTASGAIRSLKDNLAE